MFQGVMSINGRVTENYTQRPHSINNGAFIDCMIIRSSCPGNSKYKAQTELPVHKMISCLRCCMGNMFQYVKTAKFILNL